MTQFKLSVRDNSLHGAGNWLIQGPGGLQEGVQAPALTYQILERLPTVNLSFLTCEREIHSLTFKGS